ncbi:hypothetical protein CCP3SC1_1200003 [Gammaproteobacteria bacterium]
MKRSHRSVSAHGGVPVLEHALGGVEDDGRRLLSGVHADDLEKRHILIDRPCDVLGDNRN